MASPKTIGGIAAHMEIESISHGRQPRCAARRIMGQRENDDDDVSKGKKESNLQLQVPETCVLPIELLPQMALRTTPETRRLATIAVARPPSSQSTPPSSLSISPVQYT